MGRQSAAVIGSAVLILLVTVAPAAADELTCTGPIGPVTVDNLRVPDAATCALDGTRVQGTITVGNGGVLHASAVAVAGNVQAEGAHLVSVGGQSTVGGSVQIKQGGHASVVETRIAGDLQYDQMRGPLLADRNTIGGNLQAVQNVGGLTVTTNSIDGNLQCKENSPPPVGGGNVVQGSKEDQCAHL